jgi:hypothetical protein
MSGGWNAVLACIRIPSVIIESESESDPDPDSDPTYVKYTTNLFNLFPSIHFRTKLIQLTEEILFYESFCESRPIIDYKPVLSMTGSGSEMKILIRFRRKRLRSHRIRMRNTVQMYSVIVRS